MNWMIVYSAQARQDIRNIYEYIAFQLFAGETAARQIKRIFAAIRSLEQMPMRYPQYSNKQWKNKGLRFVPVDNFLVFYHVDEKNRKVSVVRIMYKGKDIQKELDVD